MGTKSEVTTTDEKANLPATFMEEFYKDAGAGLQNLKASDLQTPWIRTLQALSPQVSERNSEYIQGAKPGMFINTATGQLYDVLHLIPCAYEMRYIEWWPRNSKKGKGFVRDWGLDEASAMARVVGKDERKNNVTAEGTIIVPTPTHYVLVVNPETGAFYQGVVALTSTQSKKSRTWNTKMSSLEMQGPDGPFTPPSYAMSYRCTTKPEQNDDGNWEGWVIESFKPLPALPNAENIYRAAKKFSSQVERGEIQAGPPVPEDSEGSANPDRPAF